mmetsp:Transcript_25991/g.72798  ORF Transcript_25991/g.72798 Transcript_25991/m.72798 type:complete len:227 (-) Transcript_25991:271-951(-)
MMYRSARTQRSLMSPTPSSSTGCQSWLRHTLRASSCNAPCGRPSVRRHYPSMSSLQSLNVLALMLSRCLVRTPPAARKRPPASADATAAAKLAAARAACSPGCWDGTPLTSPPQCPSSSGPLVEGCSRTARSCQKRSQLSKLPVWSAPKILTVTFRSMTSSWSSVCQRRRSRPPSRPPSLRLSASARAGSRWVMWSSLAPTSRCLSPSRPTAISARTLVSANTPPT